MLRTRGLRWLCGFILLTPGLSAADDSRGLILYERFLGSSNSLANVFRLDTTVGYSFNKYFSIDGGLPVFFVRPSQTVTGATGAVSNNGIGNVYAEFRFALPNPALNYSSVVTGTAPTGNKNSGLSTGRPTIDWTNHFDRSFGRLTPFGNIGLANTVSDTPLFVRPYTTLGFVAHFEGGVGYRLTRFLEAGSSVYAIEPAGQQTVVSQLTGATLSSSGQSGSTQSGSPQSNKGKGNNDHQGVFETTHIAVGSAALVRDNGFSVWGAVHPTRMLMLQVGYTRSIHYALNTVSFGIVVNVGSVVRSLRSYD
jgi:hypothetical protein